MKGISKDNLTLSQFEISVESVTGGINDDHNTRFGERIAILEDAAKKISKAIGEGPLHVAMAQVGIEMIGVRSWDASGVREPKKGVEVTDRIAFHKMLRRLS